MLSAMKNFAITFCVAVLIFSGIAYLVVGFVADQMVAVTTGKDSSEETKSSAEITPELSEEAPELQGTTFNLLLIGTDYQPTLWDDYTIESNYTTGFPLQRNRPVAADTVIVIRIDKENQKCIVCPIPSSMRLSIGGNPQSVRELYSKKGVDFFVKKIAAVTGLPMDYYAVLSIENLTSVVDTFGGLSFVVPCEMQYTDPAQQLEIHLKKGMQKLTGETAAQMLRFTSYTEKGLSRTQTQIDFLKALLTEMTTLSHLSKAPAIYDTIVKYVTTNFTKENLIQNLDLIFAFSKFEFLEVSYPGMTQVDSTGIPYFEPRIEEAIRLLSAYRTSTLEIETTTPQTSLK